MELENGSIHKHAKEKELIVIEWGFEPGICKPADQKIVEKIYEPAEDINKISLLEDIIADEYIIKFSKTQLSAPENRKPEKFSLDRTSDEPYLENGCLKVRKRDIIHIEVRRRSWEQAIKRAGIHKKLQFIHFVIVLQLIYWCMERIFDIFKSFWDIPALKQFKSIPMLPSNKLRRLLVHWTKL